jgi:hypothetical protein
MRLWKKLLISLVTLIVTLMLVGIGLYVSVLPHRTDVIEKLSSPKEVKSWSTTGFVLENGTVVSLPGIHQLPRGSDLLDEISQRGIEIQAGTGRVFGLLPIDHSSRTDPVHWCGNETIGKHIARIEVARLLEFVEQRSENSIYRLTRLGWSAGCYYEFQDWLAHR